MRLTNKKTGFLNANHHSEIIESRPKTTHVQEKIAIGKVMESKFREKFYQTQNGFTPKINNVFLPRHIPTFNNYARKKVLNATENIRNRYSITLSFYC